MEAILSPLGAADGVACFTRLYLAVTRGVQERLAGVTFADGAFLARLDERFADLFFAAVERPPPAWAPLFEARARKRIAPLQFALAGMNAHINRDLPVALVQTCVEAGVALEEASPQHADYVRVNGVLATVEAQVRRDYLPHGVLGLVFRVERVAEFGADSVADVVDDVSARILDAAGADGLKVEQDFTKVFRVTALREPR